MNSLIALKTYCAVKRGIIKSNAHFWKNFYTKKTIQDLEISAQEQEEFSKKKYNIICAFDDNFPQFYNLKNSEKPFLFVYQGNINLINQINCNVGVIGVINPCDETIVREEKLMNCLCRHPVNIVSGLAKGCDTIAHRMSIKNNVKCIVFLPSTLDNIFPKENQYLANEIVSAGGVLITEYINEPKNNFEQINRFIARDRLQALFSKRIILIASFIKNKGDSGSRHAMQKAKEYGTQRYVLFNEKKDGNNPMFELNKSLIDDGAKVITKNVIRDDFS